MLLRSIFPMALFLVAFSAVHAEEPCTFTNDDVVKMVSAGLADSIVLGTMSRCKGNYDVSPDALISLKTKKVSDAIVAAMVNPPAPQPSTAKATEEQSPVQELGTYVVLKNTQIKKMTASMTTSKGSGGRVAADVFVPFAAFARHKHKQTVAGVAAELRIKEDELDHFLYFASPGAHVDSQALRLVKATVDTDKKLRILGATMSAVTGGQEQQEESIGLSIKVTKVPGLYAISTAEPIAKGEYAIVYGEIGQARTFTIHDVWDFGID